MSSVLLPPHLSPLLPFLLSLPRSSSGAGHLAHVRAVSLAMFLLGLFKRNLISVSPSERKNTQICCPDLRPAAWFWFPPSLRWLNWCIRYDENQRRAQNVSEEGVISALFSVFLEVLISYVQVQIAASARLYLATDSALTPPQVALKSLFLVNLQTRLIMRDLLL